MYPRFIVKKCQKCGKSFMILRSDVIFGDETDDVCEKCQPSKEIEAIKHIFNPNNGVITNE